MPLGRAWGYLAHGDPERALALFAITVDDHPDYAYAKVGYALAAASSGRYEDAAWAMRQAAYINVAAFERVPRTDLLMNRFNELTNRYEQRANQFGHADDHFMVASLRFITAQPGDAHRARQAVRYAIAAGDQSEEVYALEQAIEQHLASAYPAIHGH